MKDPNVRNTIARDRERDPCRKKRWKFPRFGFIFLCTLFITSEWLLLVPFYFTLIIPTLIASSSRNPSLDYIFIHYYSSLSLSLSLSAILPFTTSWFFGEVNTVEFVWFLVFWISIYIYGPFRRGQVASYINSYIWWAVCGWKCEPVFASQDFELCKIYRSCRRVFCLWGSGFVLLNDGKLRGESCCCDHGWWTHQRYEVVSYVL